MDIEGVKLAADLVTGVIVAFTGAALLLGAPRQTSNRALAFACAIYAANLVTSGVHLFLGTDRVLTYNARLLTLGTLAALAPAYLLLAGTSIPGPLTRPFSGRIARGALALVAIVLLLMPFLAPTWAVVGPPVEDPSGRLLWPARPLLAQGRLLLLFLATVYALVATLDAFRRSARGTVARERSRAFALAFGLVSGVGIVFTAVALLAPGTVLFEVTYLLGDAGTIVWVVLLARAILRYQLFDLDLRLKKGIARGTIAAVLAATFVAAEQIAGALVSGGVGLLGGVVAALLIAFAFRPVERAAQRLASALLPHAGEPERVASRKLDVYRAAFEHAREAGPVTPKGRTMLDALSRELGIRAEDARSVEAEVTPA